MRSATASLLALHLAFPDRPAAVDGVLAGYPVVTNRGATTRDQVTLMSRYRDGLPALDDARFVDAGDCPGWPPGLVRHRGCAARERLRWLVTPEDRRHQENTEDPVCGNLRICAEIP